MPDENDQELGTTQTEQSTETTTEVEQPDPSADTQQTESTTKPDWRVEKYGPDYEKNVDYWKDTSSYWRGETDKEKKKRQNRVPLESFKPEGESVAAKPNLNGNGAAQTTEEPKFDDLKELIKYLDEKNEQKTKQFFESQFSEKLGERERESNFRNSMQKARRENVGDPDNGIPSFAELEEDILLPLVKSNPKVLALLRELDGDPAENAYTLGIVVKSRNINGLRELFQRQGREQFAKKYDEVSKQAIRVKGGKSGPTTVKITPEEILNMSKEEFRKYEAQQTGKPY